MTSIWLPKWKWEIITLKRLCWKWLIVDLKCKFLDYYYVTGAVGRVPLFEYLWHRRFPNPTRNPNIDRIYMLWFRWISQFTFGSHEEQDVLCTRNVSINFRYAWFSGVKANIDPWICVCFNIMYSWFCISLEISCWIINLELGLYKSFSVWR